MLIGLVGAPNAGKSTFFKAATLAEVLIANYPFATIKPNHGMGYVKVSCLDKDLSTEEKKVQCTPREGFCIKGNRFVPIEMMDVAGLVPGASEGKGLGNRFLDDLSKADAFILVLDVSGETNEEGKPVNENEEYYPGKTIKFLEKELDMWYSGILKKVWRVFSRRAEMEKQNFAEEVAKQFSGLKVTEQDVKTVLLKYRERLNPEKPTSWSEEDFKEFARALRKQSKPLIIAANKVDTKKAQENIKKIFEEYKEYIIMPCSAESELALREAAKAEMIEYIPGEKTYIITNKGKEKLVEKQKAALNFIKESVLQKNDFGTGIQKVLDTTIFDMLNKIAVFPAGSKLVDSQGRTLADCFLLNKGSTALDFAYKLHTDLGKGFIRAIDIRTKQTVGKEHKLKHLDGIEIISR